MIESLPALDLNLVDTHSCTDLGTRIYSKPTSPRATYLHTYDIGVGHGVRLE